MTANPAVYRNGSLMFPTCVQPGGLQATIVNHATTMTKAADDSVWLPFNRSARQGAKDMTIVVGIAPATDNTSAEVKVVWTDGTTTKTLYNETKTFATSTASVRFEKELARADWYEKIGDSDNGQLQYTVRVAGGTGTGSVSYAAVQAQ